MTVQVVIAVREPVIRESLEVAVAKRSDITIAQVLRHEYSDQDVGVGRIDIAVALGEVLSVDDSAATHSTTVLITSSTGSFAESVEFWLTQFPELVIFGVDSRSGQIRSYRFRITEKRVGHSINQLLDNLRELDMADNK